MTEVVVWCGGEGSGGDGVGCGGDYMRVFMGYAVAGMSWVWKAHARELGMV